MATADKPGRRPLRIGLVAGETSGDILGAGLIQAIKRRRPDAVFEGIGGPLMLAEGFVSHVPMERLSVMGLVEVLGRLRELVGIRRRLAQHFLDQPPDVFIGIDAPDFTLGLEEKLRQAGIATVHYVSPSVWAWRQNRIFKIARAVDLMLTLFPFEARFYEEHQVPVRFVGHPLADLIPMQPDQQQARQTLGLPADRQILAILPGSRGGEVQRLGEVFLATARWLQQRLPELMFVIPAVNDERRRQIESIAAQVAPDLSLRIVDGRSREVMVASDAILLASGTATLEATLLKRPMVVAYRLAPTTYRIMRRLMKAPFVSLPNLLAQRELVPELIQDRANPVDLGKALLRLLRHEVDAGKLVTVYNEIHQQLRQGASEQAADAVLELIARKQA